jgi:hypothetical protein
VGQRTRQPAEPQNPVSCFLEKEVNVSTLYYRLTLVGCALAWFLVGLHIPTLHQMTHHGQSPHWGVVAITLLLGMGAVAGLWTFLRSPTPWPKGSS